MHRSLRLSRIAAVSFAGFLVLASTTQAQRRAGPVTGSIPSPRSVLGFNPGDDRTIADWKQITNYFALLGKNSNRVQVQTIGQSTLGRTMIAAFISAPENIRNLEKYKEIQRHLADPRLNPRDGQFSSGEAFAQEGKTVVVISCSIHSTEIVASQMSMQLAYSLASANDEDTLSILHNTILILIPSPNPDGVDIVANHYRKTLGTAAEGPFLERMVSGNRLRHSSARFERFAIFRAAVLRSTESAHRAAPAETSRINWPQDGCRRDGRGLQRNSDERALRHLVAWRFSHCALLSQLNRHSY